MVKQEFTKTYQIGGQEVEFVIAKLKPLEYLAIGDICKNAFGQLVTSKYYEQILKKCVLQPKGVDVDYFEEDLTMLKVVMNDIDSFQLQPVAFLARLEQDKERSKE